MLRLTDQLTKEHAERYPPEPRAEVHPSVQGSFLSKVQPAAQARDAKSIKEAMETNIADRLANAGDRGHKIADAIRTNDQIMRANEHLFHSEHLREMVDEVEKAGIDSKRHANEGIELTRQMAQLERKDGEAAQDFARLRYDATINGVHLDRANAFSKDGLRDAQAKARHPELQARFDRLSPEYKSMWTKLENFFQKTHNAISEKMVDYAIGATDVSKADGGRAGIRKRILDREMTDKDKELFSYQKGKALAEAHEISRVQGSYTPLNRYGDNAVRATYHVELPQGTKGTHVHEFEPGNVQFANSANQSEARRQAQDFAAKSPLEQIGAGSRWVDKNDPTKELDPGHADAIKAFTVRVQDRHFSLHDHLSDAQREAARLKADPMVKKVADVVKRSQNPNLDYEMSSPQLQTLINSLEQDKTLSADEKQITERALMDASYRMQAGNRVSHRRLPRMNVRGASLDLIHNVGEYARSTGAHLSRMDHAASIGNHLKELRQEIEARGYEGGTNSMRRSEVVNELEGRIYGSLGDMGSKMSPAMQTAMTMSYMKAMGSPGHMLIHMTHPWMISTPVLGARHGYIRAGGALTGMYRDMGGLGAIKEGAKGFMRQALDPTKSPVNWMDFFAGRLGGKYKSEILDMWKQLSDIGLIHPEAGMEVHRMDATQNVLLKGLKRTDTAMREMTGATEALNRFAETGAAYRLERSRGATHEQAIRYARDTLAESQGLYSKTNLPSAMRGKYLGAVLQFKQFPQMIYNLLASNLYQAFKGETKEIKIEAAKKFAGVVATHALMAGALGLPLEIIRAPMMLANALGVPGMDWEKHQVELTRWLAHAVGPEAAEVILHGLSRVGPTGFDGTHRLGLDNLILGLAPRSGSEDDTKLYAFSQMVGAPGEMVFDVGGGLHKMIDGDYVGGAEQMSPIKAITDIAKAVDRGARGKVSQRGNEIAAPETAIEQGLQAFGLNPARMAQSQEAAGAARLIQRDAQAARTKLEGAYRSRAPGALGAIARWNATNPHDRITTETLDQIRRDSNDYSKSKSALGQKVTKQNKWLLQSLTHDYNLGAQ